MSVLFLGTSVTGTSLRFVPYYEQGLFPFVVGHVSARSFVNAQNGPSLWT